MPEAQDPKFSNQAWDALLDRAVAKIKSLAASKGAEYSGDEDRLDNFRRGAARYGLPMEVIWGVYASKHWDSLQTYIKDLNVGRTRPYSEPIDGRVDDLLVYLLLFKAMLEERAGAAECSHTMTYTSGQAGLHWEKNCMHCGKILASGAGNPT